MQRHDAVKQYRLTPPLVKSTRHSHCLQVRSLNREIKKIQSQFVVSLAARSRKNCLARARFRFIVFFINGMDDPDRRTPREKKIRRAIVFFSSCQTSLGAVLIAMSFTAFASSSSDKIRRSCPYWSGFTVSEILLKHYTAFCAFRELNTGRKVPTIDILLNIPLSRYYLLVQLAS